jgi:hypothetical protein
LRRFNTAAGSAPEQARHNHEQRSNIKSSAATKAESIVTAAQVEAWVGTRKGSIDETARSIDATLADAALGRMMLHRRRAVTATVIGEFFARVGSRFAPYADNRAPAAPLDAANERAIAARAGELVAGLSGTQPALAFERALLAIGERRFEDARSDLKQVLAAYPGFVPAAVAAARLALKSGEPAEALRALAPVEGEITHTRGGATLLADAARAIGLHKAATRYDLAALVCLGEYDNRGNDCAPTDLAGEIADDERMPQSLYMEGQDDGSVVCNVGGIYYRVNPFIGHWFSLVNRGRRGSRMGSLGPRALARQKQTFEATTARVQLFLSDRFPATSSQLRKHLVPAARGLERILDKVFRAATSIDLALLSFFYRLYRRLPTSLRAAANRAVRSLLTALRPLVRNTIGPLIGPRGRFWLFSPITEAKARGELAQARYQTGVARIFGLGQVTGGTLEPRRPGRFLEDPFSAAGKASPQPRVLQMPPTGALPPQAEDVLRLLVPETGTARSAS